MDVDSVYRYTMLIVGTGLSIKALETLYLLPEYEKRGMFDYAISGNDRFLTGRFAPFLGVIYSKRGVATLSYLTLLSFGGVLSTDYGGLPYTLAVLLLISVNVAFYYRQAFGLDGADQMSFLILVTVCLCSILSRDLTVGQVGVWFIALQLALSYFVSGGAKLISREWRTGLAIQGILSTYTYGSTITRRLVTRSQPVCIFICWGVIITELTIPFGLLLNGPGVMVVMGVGLSMHLSIAVIMGLNDFVWGFAAAYPAFYYAASMT